MFGALLGTVVGAVEKANVGGAKVGATVRNGAVVIGAVGATVLNGAVVTGAVGATVLNGAVVTGAVVIDD